MRVYYITKEIIDLEFEQRTICWTFKEDVGIIFLGLTYRMFSLSLVNNCIMCPFSMNHL